MVMGNHVSGKRLGGLVVVGERGCDVDTSRNEEEEEEEDEELGSGDEERPPKVLEAMRENKVRFTTPPLAAGVEGGGAWRTHEVL